MGVAGAHPELPHCLILKKGGVVCGGDTRNVRACRNFRLRPPRLGLIEINNA
jgi:hypothetical protein